MRASGPNPPFNQDAAPTTYTVFCGLWAIATLFHLASYGQWDDSIYHVFLAASALWLLARPSALPRLLLLSVLQLYEVALQLPRVSNHWLFTAFVNVTIFFFFVRLAVAEKSLWIDRSAFYRAFAPVLRVELLILYFFVVFHKLNADFFSVDLSCGSVFYLAQTDFFSFLPRTPGLQTATIYGTLLVEAAIPLLLFFRRTRTAGVLVGMAFHGLIAFNPLSTFYNFSSMVFALYALFLPQPLFEQGMTRWQAVGAKLDLRRLARLSFRAQVVVFAEGVVAGLLVLVGLTLLFARRDVFLFFWIVYCLSLFVALGMAVGSPAGKTLAPQRAFAFRYRSAWWAPLLIVLNGLSPYLGLKTETSFAMYSNLRTEGGLTNHFLVPAGAQLFGYQDDLVEIVRSSDADLQSLADRNVLIPLFEVRRLTGKRRDASLSYVYQGTLTVSQRIGEDPRLASPNPFLLEKWLLFRPVAKTGRQPCKH